MTASITIRSVLRNSVTHDRNKLIKLCFHIRSKRFFLRFRLSEYPCAIGTELSFVSVDCLFSFSVCDYPFRIFDAFVRIVKVNEAVKIKISQLRIDQFPQGIIMQSFYFYSVDIRNQIQIDKIYAHTYRVLFVFSNRCSDKRDFVQIIKSTCTAVKLFFIVYVDTVYCFVEQLLVSFVFFIELDQSLHCCFRTIRQCRSFGLKILIHDCEVRRSCIGQLYFCILGKSIKELIRIITVFHCQGNIIKFQIVRYILSSGIGIGIKINPDNHIFFRIDIECIFVSRFRFEIHALFQMVIKRIFTQSFKEYFIGHFKGKHCAVIKLYTLICHRLQHHFPGADMNPRAELNIITALTEVDVNYLGGRFLFCCFFSNGNFPGFFCLRLCFLAKMRVREQIVGSFCILLDRFKAAFMMIVVACIRQITLKYLTHNSIYLCKSFTVFYLRDDFFCLVLIYCFCIVSKRSWDFFVSVHIKALDSSRNLTSLIPIKQCLLFFTQILVLLDKSINSLGNISPRKQYLFIYKQIAVPDGKPLTIISHIDTTTITAANTVFIFQELCSFGIILVH